METQELFRGRLIDHIQLVVSDVQVSRAFYSAILGELNIPVSGEGEDFFWADELVVSGANSPAAQGKLTGRVHLAFQAPNEEVVQKVYERGLQAGGKDNGAPGLRPYHPGYYAAFMLDPDGNNIEVAYHGPAQRSSDAIKITF